MFVLETVLLRRPRRTALVGSCDNSRVFACDEVRREAAGGHQLPLGEAELIKDDVARCTAIISRSVGESIGTSHLKNGMDKGTS